MEPGFPVIIQPCAGVDIKRGFSSEKGDRDKGVGPRSGSVSTATSKSSALTRQLTEATGQAGLRGKA